MKRIILAILLLCAVIIGGCSEMNQTAPQTDGAKQEAKQISFIVYRAASMVEKCCYRKKLLLLIMVRHYRKMLWKH